MKLIGIDISDLEDHSDDDIGEEDLSDNDDYKEMIKLNEQRD